MTPSIASAEAALHAAADGSADRLRTLLAQGVHTETAGDDGSTLLIHAAAGGHQECVDLLLRAGADVDAQNREGVSPLLIVCFNNGPVELVEQLLAWGADPDLAAPDEKSPLAIAVWRGSLESVRALLDSGATGIARALMVASDANGEAIKELLIRGAQRRHDEKNAEPRVFISYRRADTGPFVGRLRRSLQQHLGPSSVFLDQPGGLEFRKWIPALEAALTASDILLAVIGPAWADPVQSERLQDPDDVVRREIEWFLKTHADHGFALPVLFGDATVPSTAALPRSVRPLFDAQAYRVGIPTWPSDVHGLAEGIRAMLARSEGELLAILQRAADEPGDPDACILPHVAGEQFRDMPIVGRWEIVVTEPRPSACGHSTEATLLLDLTPDYLFRGEQVRPGEPPVRLDGRWTLTLWDEGGLLLSLETVVDRQQAVRLKIPAAVRRGRGYFANARDGTTYWWESRGGRSLESVESL